MPILAQHNKVFIYFNFAILISFMQNYTQYLQSSVKNSTKAYLVWYDLS